MSNDDPTKIAQMTVHLLDNGAFAIEYRGEDRHKTTMAGIIELVKRRLIDEYEEALNYASHDISKEVKTVQNGSELPNLREFLYNAEQEVPRNKALEATEYALAMLTQRKKDMEEAAPEQTFRINPTLLQHL